jgi:hypothetical protein
MFSLINYFDRTTLNQRSYKKCKTYRVNATKYKGYKGYTSTRSYKIVLNTLVKGLSKTRPYKTGLIGILSFKGLSKSRPYETGFIGILSSKGKNSLTLSYNL